MLAILYHRLNYHVFISKHMGVVESRPHPLVDNPPRNFELCWSISIIGCCFAGFKGGKRKGIESEQMPRNIDQSLDQ